MRAGPLLVLGRGERARAVACSITYPAEQAQAVVAGGHLERAEAVAHSSIPAK